MNGVTLLIRRSTYRYALLVQYAMVSKKLLKTEIEIQELLQITLIL